MDGPNQETVRHVQDQVTKGTVARMSRFDSMRLALLTKYDIDIRSRSITYKAMLCYTDRDQEVRKLQKF